MSRMCAENNSDVDTVSRQELVQNYSGIGHKLPRKWSQIAQEMVTDCSGNAELGKNFQELSGGGVRRV